MDSIEAALTRAYVADPSDINARRLANMVARRVDGPKTHKIIVSPDYGSDWSAYKSGDHKKFLLTHPGLIAAIESYEDSHGMPLTEDHPAVIEFLEDAKKAGHEAPYLGGLDSLEVWEVKGPFVVTEYDGAEGMETLGSILKRLVILD